MQSINQKIEKVCSYSYQLFLFVRMKGICENPGYFAKPVHLTLQSTALWSVKVSMGIFRWIVMHQFQ